MTIHDMKKIGYSDGMMVMGAGGHCIGHSGKAYRVDIRADA